MECKNYETPREMKRVNGCSRFAFVAFLMLNDNYLPGTLTLAYGLRKQRTRADLVCLVTAEVGAGARRALEALYDRVIEVDQIFVPHKRRQQRQDRPFYFTRLNALRLGADGDLGLAYEKVVVLDSDVLPFEHYDHLFSLKAPAGIINERKDHFIEVDARGRYLVPSEVETTGTWKWHRIYGDICPHGRPIPREITDRVQNDPTNMGINGSLFVLEPSLREFESILEDVDRSQIRLLVGDLFDWPDMQYLTMRWSGRWTSVDLRFSGFNGYPGISFLFGTHFAGFKPWYFKRARTMARYGRHADFQRWFAEYAEMVRVAYPELQQNKKLAHLLRHIGPFKARRPPPYGG